MSSQKTLWQGKTVLVVSSLSESGEPHRYVKPYVGRSGKVLKESKSGMLLIDFSDGDVRGIPASCIILYYNR